MADKKEIEEQVFFAEDAISEPYINGQVISSLKERKQSMSFLTT